MNINNPLDVQNPTNFQISHAGAFLKGAKVFVGSFVCPHGRDQAPTASSNGTHQVSPTEERFGPRLTRISQAAAQKFDRTIDESLGEGRVADLGKEHKGKLIDTGRVADNLMEDVQGILTSTSPQEFAKGAANELTNFLRVYTHAYQRIQKRKAEGLFLTPEGDEAAWKLFMGENYWLPTLHQKIEENRTNSFTFLQRDNFIPSVIGGGAVAKAVANPHVQAFINKETNPPREGMAIQENDQSPIFQAVIDGINSFIFHLSTLGLREEAEHPGQNSLGSLFKSRMRNLATERFAEAPPLDLEPHQFLVEQIGTKQVVSHCSQEARRLGIRPGMESSRAALIWNGRPNYAEGPQAILIDDVEQFGGRKTLRESLKNLILNLLTLPTAALRETILQRILNIPYLGRPLAALTRAILWLGGALVGGFNSFAVGFPSREVLAEEITNNLIAHLFNPAFIAAPLVVINRIFEMVEQKPIETVDGAPARDAYLGELVVELMKLFTTICPSLFKIKRPKVVEACVAAAYWLLRKVGTRVLVNRFTLRFAPPSLTDWLQESARTVRESTDLLATTHSIISSGYRKLGEMGSVSTEQSHFIQGSQSKEHLIHHTLLAVGRYYISMNQFSEHHAFKDSCDELIERLDRNDPLNPGDVQFIEEKVTEKMTKLEEQRTFANRLLNRLNTRLPLTTQELIQNFSSGFRLAWIVDDWNQIQQLIQDELTRQVDQNDECSQELKLMLNTLRSGRFEQLASRFESIRYKIQETDVEDVKLLTKLICEEMEHHEKLRQQLIVYYTAQRNFTAPMIADCNAYLQDATNPQQVRTWVARLLRESEILTFSEKYAAEEERLKDSIRQYDTMIQESLREYQEDVQSAENDPVILAHLAVAKQEFWQRHGESIQQLPGRRAPIQQEETGFWGRLKRGVSQVWHGTVETVKDWNEEQLARRSTSEEIDFYLPGTFIAHRNRIASQMALKEMEERKLADLRKDFKGKALFFDPVWVLEQSGEQLFNALKNHLPANMIASLINSQDVDWDAPVEQVLEPVVIPAVPAAEPVVVAVEEPQPEPAAPVEEPQAAPEVAAVEQPQAPVEQVVEQPVPVEVEVPQQNVVIPDVEPVEEMKRYVKNIVIYRGYHMLRNAWNNN